MTMMNKLPLNGLNNCRGLLRLLFMVPRGGYMAWCSASDGIILLMLLFTTEGVKPCALGKYGPCKIWSCEIPCPVHCAPQSGLVVSDCDSLRGGCYDGCVPGWYGSHCNQTCGTNCINKICNRFDGTCTKGCKEKYIGFFCREVLIDGVIQCVPGQYGAACDKHCDTHCAPRPGSTVGHCGRSTGICYEGCVAGWFGDHCNNTCSRNCKNNTCDSDNGYCSRGCKEKQMIGDFCTEVLIDGVIQCVPGQYGAACDKHCDTHCAPRPGSTVGHCGRSTGICYEGCVAGWFGDHCNNTCSRNCRNNTCDRDNGYCSRGCKEKQMIGDFCTEVQSAKGVTRCIAGHYGASCELPCPPHCAMRRESDVRDCDRHTARCNRGCRTGWYGDHCNNTCNNNCKENICDRDTGKCYGSCLSGWYGDHCNNTCNINCIDNICNRDTGHCTLGCTGTYTAELCTEVADKGPQVNTDLSYLIIPMVIGSALLMIIAALQIAIYLRRILLHNRSQQSWSELEAMYPEPVQSAMILRYAEGSDQHACSELEAMNPEPAEESEQLAMPTVALRRPLEGDPALLHEASRKGDLANVKRILATGRADVNSRGTAGMTPMMWAAQHGHRELGEFLVFEGAEVSLVDDDGKNTLHHACAGGHVEMVEFVLSRNVVDINSRGWWGMTPVMEAVLSGRKKVLEFLVKKGADVSLVDEYGDNILHRACWGGHLEMVEFVLSLKKLDIKARNAFGETATDLARFMKHPGVVALMESRGAQ